MTPLVEVEEVEALLRRRRYVVLQGPPGTGKARVAEELKKGRYAGRAKSVQFHANTTYESFVGGLGPRVGAAGLQFEPVPGALMEAVQEAMASERPYLLHVDEINRADVGKVLGECLYLLEADGETRAVELAHDFGGQIGRRLRIPPNLHILGTMNSSDRSIALVDVAVRRRFGFLTLWPRMDVVEHLGCSLMRKAFAKLQRVFLNYATDEVLLLMPGHSYFLEMDEERAKEKLQVELAPLLEEYLAQGYVSGFREEVRAYLQWLRAVRSN
jgi:5-methylcytosine-specific restriction protein B